MKNYIWPIWALMPITTAHAYLQASVYTEPGIFCDSECTSEEEGCGQLNMLDCGTFDCSDIPQVLYITSKPACVIEDNDNYNKDCYVGKSNNSYKYYYCDRQGENACSTLGFISQYYSDWKTYNTSRHSVSRQKYFIDDSNYNICKINSNQTSTEYGCAAGYYATANTGGANISCTPCPNGATSDIGTAAITSCYLGPGTYSDSHGTFQISGSNCYYN